MAKYWYCFFHGAWLIHAHGDLYCPKGQHACDTVNVQAGTRNWRKV
jgi:hypothetical protein